MGVITWDQAVDIGGGRGRLAPAPAASLARVDRDMRSAFGRAADINEAWRSPAAADENYRKYIAYLNGGAWAPIALPGDKSVHCFGYAVDTDDTSDAQMRIWNDHGWYWTVYRDGKLVERWHLEYFPGRDNHRNDPAPAGVGNATPISVQEDDMFDDNAKKDAADRHTEVMKALKQIHRAAAPFKVLSWGTGLVVFNPDNGKLWILPEGYSDLLQALGLVGGDAFAASTEQLTFATGFLPATIGDRDGDGFTSADLDEIKKAIAGAQVAVTPEQLQKLLDAVGTAARDGGEAGARDALQKLTFVVTAS